MDAGHIIGTGIAGSAVLSGLVIGAGVVYGKAVDALTQKPEQAAVTDRSEAGDEEG